MTNADVEEERGAGGGKGGDVIQIKREISFQKVKTWEAVARAM